MAVLILSKPTPPETFARALAELNFPHPVHQSLDGVDPASIRWLVAWRLRDDFEVYASAGRGFHSNDARGAVIQFDPVSGDPAERVPLVGRSVVARRLRALPVEAVVRGYLIGSGWKDYQSTGEVCGVPLPAGLRLADRLPEPIFTPATKAAVGDHDENIAYGRVVELLGQDLAEKVRSTALKLYEFAAAYALERGIIIADTKFEFGLDQAGRLVLIDEALTPDSSRFWPVASYAPGTSPPSFDKQFVRDYLETLDWNKRAPGPQLPPEVITRTADKYAKALRLLTT
jgi:phosphoribosylaminoimidazole-succinocarboxamide synthase